MNTWGNKIRLSIFGESHGRAIGIIVDGLPPGEAMDIDLIQQEMMRRAPGQDEFSTARKEGDVVEILSGLYEGRTTGFPICGIIYNGDTRSKDYNAVLRPGHADWTALMKYKGNADMRGGGHFSGRLTAPLTFAGSMAKQILQRRGIGVYGRIQAIGGIVDETVSANPENWAALSKTRFPLLDPAKEEQMKGPIKKARLDCDSVGGIIETVAFGVPGGLGEPFFRSAESVISAMLFSVPAVKGIEFGDGFTFSHMRGSEANDPLCMEDKAIKAKSNHNGGILGGITNGMPLIVRAAIKPTPSISKEQQSVNASTMQEVSFQIHGRHDPCIVPRAVVVVESGVALSLLDLLLEANG